jgi:hypothetical protein
MSCSYPPEFRHEVLDLVAPGRPVKQVAEMLDISNQTTHNGHDPLGYDAPGSAPLRKRTRTAGPRGHRSCTSHPIYVFRGPLVAFAFPQFAHDHSWRLHEPHPARAAQPVIYSAIISAVITE